MHVESVFREAVFVYGCSLGTAVWSIVRGMSRRGSLVSIVKGNCYKVVTM